MAKHFLFVNFSIYCNPKKKKKKTLFVPKEQLKPHRAVKHINPMSSKRISILQKKEETIFLEKPATETALIFIVIVL